MSTIQKWGARIAVFAFVAAVVITPLLGAVSKAHAADDYLITASDTVPIFTTVAAVGKAQFVNIANVGLVYYVGFMIALVILLLVLLPVKKIWGLISGHSH